jgi:hypothetical protein
MKLDFNSYLKHANHEIMVDTTPVAHNVASLRCVKCDKHIKWLSKEELSSIQNIMAPTHYGTEGVKTRPVRSKSKKKLR